MKNSIKYLQFVWAGKIFFFFFENIWQIFENLQNSELQNSVAYSVAWSVSGLKKRKRKCVCFFTQNSNRDRNGLSIYIEPIVLEVWLKITFVFR